MKYKALKTFVTNKISMAMGDVGEISDKALAKDLLKTKYIEQIESRVNKKSNNRRGKDEQVKKGK